MPDTRLRSDALADDALAFLKPLVVGVWGAVAVVALANAASQHRAFVGFADGAGQAVSTKGFNPISQGETR